MDEQQANWSYKQDDDYSAQAQSNHANSQAPTASINWVGSEFIANAKSTKWFLGLAGFTLLVCAIVYLISKDILAIVFIVIMSLLFAVIAAKPPRQVEYLIDDQGISVGSRHYYYSDFKSFSIQRHGAMEYVNLLPLHRLRNELSIYFPPENSSQIFEVLASRIPNEQRRENPIDKLAKLIRF